MSTAVQPVDSAHNSPTHKPTDLPSPGLKNTIIDIRSETDGFSILSAIKSGLRPANGGEKSLPTLLLYDEAGLKIYEEITYLDEYYLVEAEIETLTKYADQIAKQIAPNSIIVELGSGYDNPTCMSSASTTAELMTPIAT